ncbi:MAG: carboxypeptidase-like regulatory domain-containing protein, partial [Phaeodactylibacter sp.]|nr:carboxypeptidase-like regulatory domain-containing protein [Phaeodactylibacter sp.]
MRRSLCLLVLVLMFASVTAQQRTITGMVRSTEGELLIGATILLPGTDQGTATDYEGKYILDIPADAEELVFSYTGMQTKTLTVGNRTRLDVILRPDDYIET